MSVAGTYKTIVKSPMGDQTGTLTVVPNGDSFTGSLVGSLGSMDINDGTVEGDTIKWKMNMVVPMPMTLDSARCRFRARAKPDRFDTVTKKPPAFALRRLFCIPVRLAAFR